jgi:phage-related protein
VSASVLEWTLVANDRASDKFDRLGKRVDSTGARFAKFGKIATVALAAVAVASIKVAADSVAAASDAEKAQNRLAVAWSKSALTADVSVTAIRSLNTELQKTTKYDDDLIASAQGVLANFKLTGTQIRELTPLLLDYASRTGKDLPTAATDLGKALLGQGRALKAIGINFKDTGTAAGNFAELTSVLKAQVGGFASSEATTLAGKMAILKNRFGEIQETIGRALIGPLTSLADIIDGYVAPALEKFAAWFGNKLPEAFAVIAPHLPEIAEGFVRIATAISQEGVLTALEDLVTKALPPLVDLLVAIAPLIPPLAAGISGILVPAVGLLSTAISGLTSLFSGNLDTQRAWLRQLIAAGGPISFFVKNIASQVSGFFNFIYGAANLAVSGIENVVNALSALTGVSIHLPRIKTVTVGGLLLGPGQTKTSVQTRTGGPGGVNAGQFASGGIVTKPTYAMVGEGGEPEGIFPLSKAKSMGFGGGSGGLSVTFTGPVYGANAAELGRQVTDSIVRGINSGQLSAAPLQQALGVTG